MNEKILLRDEIALSIISGLFARESQTKMDISDKHLLADFIWNTADIILEHWDKGNKHE